MAKDPKTPSDPSDPSDPDGGRPLRGAVRDAFRKAVTQKNQAIELLERIKRTRKTKIDLTNFARRHLTNEDGWFNKQREFFSTVGPDTGLSPQQQKKVFDIAFGQAFQTFSPEQRRRLDTVIGGPGGKSFASLSSNQRVDIMEQALTEGKETNLILKLVNRGRRALRPTARHFAAHYGSDGLRPNYIPSTLSVQVNSTETSILKRSGQGIEFDFEKLHEGSGMDPRLRQEFETFNKSFFGSDQNVFTPKGVELKIHRSAYRAWENEHLDARNVHSKYEFGFKYKGSDFTLKIPTISNFEQNNIGYSGENLNVRRIMNPVGILDDKMGYEQFARNVFFMKKVNEELMPALKAGSVSADQVRGYIGELHDIFNSQEVSSGRAFSPAMSRAQRRYEMERSAALQLFERASGSRSVHGIPELYSMPESHTMMAALKANSGEFGIDISETRFEQGMVGFFKDAAKPYGLPMVGDLAVHEFADPDVVERARLDQKIRNRTMAPEAMRSYYRSETIQQQEYRSSGRHNLIKRIEQIAKKTGMSDVDVQNLILDVDRKSLGQETVNKINYDLRMKKEQVIDKIKSDHIRPGTHSPNFNTPLTDEQADAKYQEHLTTKDHRGSTLKSNIQSAQKNIFGPEHRRLFTNNLSPEEIILYGMAGDKQIAQLDNLNMSPASEHRYHQMKGQRLENARSLIFKMRDTLDGVYGHTTDPESGKRISRSDLTGKRSLEARNKFLADNFGDVKGQRLALEDAGYLLAKTGSLPYLSENQKKKVEKDMLMWLNQDKFGKKKLSALGDLIDKEGPEVMDAVRQAARSQERPVQLASIFVATDSMTGNFSELFGSGEGIMKERVKQFLTQTVTENKILETLNPEAFELLPGSQINENKFTAGGFAKDAHGQFKLKADNISRNTIIGWDTKGRAIEWDQKMDRIVFFENDATAKSGDTRRLIHMEYDTLMSPESHSKLHGDQKQGVSFVVAKMWSKLSGRIADMLPSKIGQSILRQQSEIIDNVTEMQWGRGKKSHRHIRQMATSMHTRLSALDSSVKSSLSPAMQEYLSQDTNRVSFARENWHLPNWEGAKLKKEVTLDKSSNVTIDEYALDKTRGGKHWSQTKEMMTWYLREARNSGMDPYGLDPTKSLFHQNNFARIFGLVGDTFGEDQTRQMISEAMEAAELGVSGHAGSAGLLERLYAGATAHAAEGIIRQSVGDPMSMQGAGNKGTIEPRAFSILTSKAFGGRGEEIADDWLKRMYAHDQGPEGEGKWAVNEELKKTLTTTIQKEKVPAGALTLDLSKPFEITDMQSEFDKKLALAAEEGSDLWIKMEGNRGVYVPSGDITGMSSETIETHGRTINSQAEIQGHFRNFIKNMASDSGSTTNESLTILQDQLFKHHGEMGKGMGGLLRGSLPGSKQLIATSRSALGETMPAGNVIGINEQSARRMTQEMIDSDIYSAKQIVQLEQNLEKFLAGETVGGVVARHPFIGGYSLQKTLFTLIKDPGNVIVTPEINVQTSVGGLKLGAMLGLAGDYDFDSLIAAFLDPDSQSAVAREMDFSVADNKTYAQAYLNHQVRYQLLNATADVSATGGIGSVEEQAGKNIIKTKYTGKLSNEMSKMKFYAQSYQTATDAAEVYALSEWLEQKPISSKHASPKALDDALNRMLTEFEKGTSQKGLEDAVSSFIDPESKGLGDIILSHADADEIEKAYGIRPQGKEVEGGILLEGFDIQRITRIMHESRSRAIAENLEYDPAMLKGGGGKSAVRSFIKLFLGAEKGLGAAISTADNIVANLMGAAGASGITGHKGIMAAMAVGSLFGLNSVLSQPREMVGPGKHLDSRARMNMSKAAKRLQPKDVKPPRAPIGTPTAPHMLSQRRAMIAAKPKETNHYLVRARVNNPGDVALITQQLQQFTSLGNSVNISVRDSRGITNKYADSNKRY